MPNRTRWMVAGFVILVAVVILVIAVSGVWSNVCPCGGGA